MLDPSATLHSRFITAIQNAPYTHIFALTLVTFIVLTGAFVPLAIAFALALTASLVYQLLVLPPRPAPARSAVLITGAGTGLGFDMAVRLAGLGVTVYAGVWQAAEGDRLLEAAGGGSGGGGSSGGRIVPLVLDVTKQADIDAALATISSAVQSGRQRLYGLVSNAGYGAHGPIELLSLDRLRAQFEVNAFAAVRLTQTFLPLLRAGASAASPSRIVLTSSMNGRVTVAGKTAYCSSKHALEAIGDNLRTELYPSHIRTTIIEPVCNQTNCTAKAVTAPAPSLSLSLRLASPLCRVSLSPSRCVCCAAARARHCCRASSTLASSKPVSPTPTACLQRSIRTSRSSSVYRPM